MKSVSALFISGCNKFSVFDGPKYFRNFFSEKSLSFILLVTLHNFDSSMVVNKRQVEGC